MPLVSVLISAYNVEQYVEQSIMSILEQTHTNLEVLVVDDGSSDNTHNILSKIKDPRINYYSQNNKGKAATLNDLIKLAKGEFIMIHDADDLSKHKRVSELLKNFKDNPNIGMAMSSF